MPLETGTWITDLVQTNPVGGTDKMKTVDDHIRLVKSVLRQSFPGQNFPIAASNDSGIVNAYKVTLSPAPPAYQKYFVVVMQATNANTGACTLEEATLGAPKPIKLSDGNDPPSGAIRANGVHTFFYDGTNFILTNPVAGVFVKKTGDTMTGRLTISTGVSGATPDATMGLVVEAGSTNGITVIQPDTSFGQFIFGSPSDNYAAGLLWKYSDLLLEVGTHTANGILELHTADRVRAVRINANQNVLIGTTTAATGNPRLDIVGSDFNVLSLSNNSTNLTTKDSIISSRHYTNAEENFSGIRLESGSTTSAIYYGGSSTSFNAATQHHFYTAANTTTLTGTERVRISNSAINLTLLTKIGGAVGDIPDGAGLHIESGSAGAISASADADELVVEGSGDTGITVLSGNTSVGRIQFGTTTDVSSAFLWWDAANSVCAVGTGIVSGLLDFYTGNGNRVGRWNDAGNLLIGTTTAATGGPRVDIVGSLTIGSNATDATLKNATFSGRHYTNAEETVSILIGQSNVSDNIAYYGGSSGSLNSMTSHRFYTAANTTTVSGTERVRLSNSAINLTLNTKIGGAVGDTPIATLDIVGGNSTVVLSNNETDATQKDAGLGLRHYTNAEEVFGFLRVTSSVTENVVTYGSNTAINTNAATRHSFVTAANNTTLGGTERVRVGTAVNITLSTSIGRAIGSVPRAVLDVETSLTDAAYFVSTDNGATVGPILFLFRDSSSPATNDSIGYIQLRGRNSVGTEVQYGHIRGLIASPTNGAETGEIIFATTVSNATVDRMTIRAGLQMGTPTGGDKGTGSINVALDVFKNNSAYLNPDYALEHYFTGKIERFADRPGAGDYPGLMPLDELEEFVREHWHLPRVPRTPVGMFERGDIALEKIEEIFLHLIEAKRRMDDIERRIH